MARNLWIALGIAAGIGLALCGTVDSAERRLHTFERIALTDVYYSEGANAGDLNGDGALDVVYGPFWFEGPDFIRKHEIHPPVPQDVNAYADHFFAWIRDFNGDGRNDVFVVGFPGKPAHVYENPGPDGWNAHWKKHEVLDWVSNESPQLTNLVGDERPEVVFTRDGFFGFATIPDDDPFGAWTFHPVSEKVAATKFGHGLGIGDVNGDGRNDILHAGGWFEQPESDAAASRWLFHPRAFSTAYGGAEMYAYDVDGDGDNDVITSHAAHDFGLGWYEQTRENGEIAFTHHLIMGSHPSENKYGVVFSEPHSVNLADIDGDGLKDIVTGKTYWSHHKKSPMWDAGAVVYWFKLVRNADGVDWIPYQADGESGVGRQLSVVDVNADGLLDLVVGGMKGSHVLIHRSAAASEEQWKAAQPSVYQGPKPVSPEKGPKPAIDGRAGRVDGALEGEGLPFRVSGGKARSQPMGRFGGDRWSGDAQWYWTGAKAGDTVAFDLPPFTGTVDIELVLTRAPDYGIVQWSLDDRPLGPPIDGYHTEVATTGVLTFAGVEAVGDKHALNGRVIGSNPRAVPSLMCGVDFIRVKRADGSVVASAAAERPESGPEPRGNEYVAAGRDGRALNLDFETGNLDDWTAEGNAFDGQPIQGDAVVTRRGDMRSGHQGRYWIGGFEKVRDAGTGTLTSDVFPASHAYASFLMNGGNHENTRVEMIREDTGDVFFRIAGTNDETMRPVIVDLRAHLGKPIRIRLVDENRGGWGHINFDHFRMHDDRPAPLTPPMVALVPDEYPHSGLSAAEAAAAMDAPEGFSILVGASEPDVKQPIAMALDDRGRVWIAEAYEYPVRAKGDRGRDRILIFEDTDGDGTLDKRSIFTEGLNLVSGLEVGFGGVWVGAAPYLLFIPDADRDDKPDGDPQVLLDGWGYQDTHETANAFIWGPDGWLYGCHGVFTHSRVGRPGTPDEQRVPLNAAVWRYHPTRHAFEVFAHGTSNPWGVDFNDHGQAFVTACVIPHLFHIIQGARYQRQGGQHFNPYTYRDIVTIADHLHYLGATPHGGNSKSDGAGGGHAHAGAMIYLGDRWPASYRDQLFMNNIHGQRLNVDWLEPRGSGYVGRHGPDFLLTGDKASQILNLRYGPDGNAWMIDWYDMQACHRTEVEIHDRTNGRIYKVAYGNPKDAFQPIDASARTDLELAEWTLHANDWYVRHARRVLQERASSSSIAPEAIDRLASIATAHSDDTRRLRALWALHVTGRLTDAIAGRLLADASPYVRGWAVQLMLERFAAESPGAAPPAPFLDRLAAMSRDDESPIVRLYLASAAQRLPLDARWTILEGLARHAADAEDPNLPLMYWYAAEPLADVDTSRALAFAMSAGESIPLLREFMLRRIGSSDSGASLDVLAKGLETAETSELRLAFLQALRAALRGQRRAAPPERWAAVSERVLGDADERVRLHATVVGVAFGDSAALEAMRTRAAERSTPLDTRLAALQALLDAGDAGSVPLLRAMLDEPGPIQESAIRGLAQFDDPAVSADLLNVYATLSQQAKRLALGTLCARTNSALALLGAIRDKRVPGTDLTADLVRGLQLLKNDQVDALLTEAWGTVRESEADRKAMIVELTRLVESPDHPAADPALGRAVFAKTCMKCHALFGVGETIGPDLTGSNRANLDYLLSNIVDPSAVMAREYRPTIVVTTDGRVVTGLIQAEDERSVTLRTGDGVVVVPKAEVDTRSESEKSMMPDDQLRPFTEHEVRSLVSYVRGPRQSPILATAENRGALFNGRDLTGWSGTDGLWSVENGEIVGRTEGLARNEWLVSDLAVDDFRLTLDVKLVDNAGNSGVQFRSRANDGEVAGYQADIGAGWWGKLYEEHGRALLWDKSGEAHIRPGEWTTYEITARGHHIQTFLNGAPGVDLEDPTGATRGVIAFQLHSGGKTEVRFRNLRLEVLESK